VLRNVRFGQSQGRRHCCGGQRQAGALDGIEHLGAEDLGQRLVVEEVAAGRRRRLGSLAAPAPTAAHLGAPETLTMSGSRLTLGGRMKFGIVHRLRSTCSVKNFQPYRSSSTPLHECAPSKSVKYSARSFWLSASTWYEKLLAHAPHATCVRLDGLGPQALELQMLQVALVLSFKMLRKRRRHDGCLSFGCTQSRARIGSLFGDHTGQISGLGLAPRSSFVQPFHREGTPKGWRLWSPLMSNVGLDHAALVERPISHTLPLITTPHQYERKSSELWRNVLRDY
jgi:hypothetical protein